ncbi:MAG TPA: ATP-binding cassette domain-containing protein, partial [Nordella sp.]|nr:ATP-binding cassette domain-containing protein [Nordella sp.]
MPITFSHVSFAYPNGSLAVDDVSFTVAAGERLAIVGQNGAGKTTTVKLMNGLLKPT